MKEKMLSTAASRGMKSPTKVPSVMNLTRSTVKVTKESSFRVTDNKNDVSDFINYWPTKTMSIFNINMFIKLKQFLIFYTQNIVIFDNPLFNFTTLRYYLMNFSLHIS